MPIQGCSHEEHEANSPLPPIINQSWQIGNCRCPVGKFTQLESFPFFFVQQFENFWVVRPVPRINFLRYGPESNIKTPQIFFYHVPKYTSHFTRAGIWFGESILSHCQIWQIELHRKIRVHNFPHRAQLHPRKQAYFDEFFPSRSE